MMNILKKGDYWLWEYYWELATMSKHDRAIVKELRKIKAGQ
jgi:hypothetical protein